MKEQEGAAAAAVSERTKLWYSSVWGSTLVNHEGEWLMASLKKANAKVVFEAGCGVGPFLKNAVNHLDSVHGLGLSVKALVEKIVEISGKAIEPLYDPSKPVGPLSRTADVGRAKSLLGWEPRVSLDEGLRQTFRWVETKLKGRE